MFSLKQNGRKHLGERKSVGRSYLFLKKLDVYEPVKSEKSLDNCDESSKSNDS